MQSRRVVSAVANERTRVTNVGNHLGQINFDSRETESFKTRAEEKAKSCQVNHKNRPTFRSLNGEICYLSWRLWKLYTCIFRAEFSCEEPILSAFIVHFEIPHKSAINLDASKSRGSGRGEADCTCVCVCVCVCDTSSWFDLWKEMNRNISESKYRRYTRIAKRYMSTCTI